MYQQESQPEPERSDFELLYRRHMPVLLAYVNRQISSREDAEDLLVEVFLAALEYFERLQHFDERAQLAWLKRVAHNKLVDFYRRAKRKPVTSLDEQGDVELLVEDNDLTPEEAALRKEEYAWVRAHLEQLSQTQQEVVRLHFVAGLRCVEIAQLQNKREGSVRMLLARALNGLRSLYEQQQKEEKRR
jgi:RNA polymerase sigma factor (sigma-70 family)